MISLLKHGMPARGQAEKSLKCFIPNLFFLDTRFLEISLGDFLIRRCCLSTPSWPKSVLKRIFLRQNLRPTIRLNLRPDIFGHKILISGCYQTSGKSRRSGLIPGYSAKFARYWSKFATGQSKNSNSTLDFHS